MQGRKARKRRLEGARTAHARAAEQHMQAGGTLQRLRLAPSRASARTTSTSSCSAAIMTGEAPLVCATRTARAGAHMRAALVAHGGHHTFTCRRVHDALTHCWSMGAPEATRSSHAATCPFWAAISRGVAPSVCESQAPQQPALFSLRVPPPLPSALTPLPICQYGKVAQRCKQRACGTHSRLSRVGTPGSQIPDQFYRSRLRRQVHWRGAVVLKGNHTQQSPYGKKSTHGSKTRNSRGAGACGPRRRQA